MSAKRGLIPKLAERYPSLQRPPMGLTPLGLDLWMEREVRRLLAELGYKWRLTSRPGKPKHALLLKGRERRVGYAEKAWAALARALLDERRDNGGDGKD